MVRKFQKARGIKGFRFMHILAPCPPGWKYDSERTVALSRLAIQTGLFALYEIEDGRFRLNMNVAVRKPVGEFLRGQGRFKGLTPEGEAAIQAGVDARWQVLQKR
jgi:pyruvate ferredoxin oxidoreductase beta subunit